MMHVKFDIPHRGISGEVTMWALPEYLKEALRRAITEALGATPSTWDCSIRATAWIEEAVETEPAAPDNNA